MKIKTRVHEGVVDDAQEKEELYAYRSLLRFFAGYRERKEGRFGFYYESPTFSKMAQEKLCEFGQGVENAK